jgi:hypothetical protein
MKIRSGFVSNSSSSSFILLVRPELHERALKELAHPYYDQVLNYLATEGVAFGEPIVRLEEWSDRDGGGTWDSYYDGPTEEFSPEETGVPKEGLEIKKGKKIIQYAWDDDSFGQCASYAFEEYNKKVRELDPDALLHNATSVDM